MKPAPRRTVRVFPDRASLDECMFGEWCAAAKRAIRRSGRFAAALSGGLAPVPFYERLADGGRDLPWEDTHVFLADERFVPKDDPDSNFGMIERTLLRRVPVPRGNLHTVPVRLKPEAAAEGYERSIRRFFGLKPGGAPRFDLVLLGIGEEGHTASLFPGDPAMKESRRLAVAVARPAREHDRVTLTLPAINAARLIAFLVSGPDKAEALKASVEERPGGPPASLVRPRRGRIVFLADEGSARLLAPTPPASEAAA